MQKIVHPAVENPKGRLGQKWVSWWAEKPKGKSRQKLRIKSVRLCPMKSTQSNSMTKVQVQMVQDQSNQFRSMTKDVRRHWGNSRAGRQWDHFTWLFVFISQFYFPFWQFPLTRIPVSMYKNAYSWAKYQYKYTLKWKFSVSVLNANLSKNWMNICIWT